MKAWFILFMVFALKTSQGQVRSSHPTILGARLNIIDIYSNAPFQQANRGEPGIGFSFVKGLNRHLDWQVSIDGTFADSLSKEKLEQKRFLFQAEAKLRLRFLPPTKRLQPLATAGLGISSYNNAIEGLIPVGAGLQYRIFKDAYVVAESQYRISIPGNIQSHYFYTFGFYGNIFNTRSKTEPVGSIVLPSPVAAVDTDRDGILDSADACPDVPGMASFLGCPDRDNDRIPDKDDKCPDLAGAEKYSGCPIPDTDGDGINDEEDSCVSIVGVKTYNGCPAPDKDGDGVIDTEDACPDRKGDVPGRGCPPVSREVSDRVTQAAKHILFLTGRYDLSKTSFRFLDEVLSILHADTLLFVTIEGHTDNKGGVAANQLLSEQRAETVKAYLVANGITRHRISVVGYGQMRPIRDNRQAAGRKANRRTEFKLYYR